MENESSDFDIIIVECCQHCETHQQVARHSEWKYFEQFTELKRKIEKFINNSIVIKNPIPDEIIKTPELKSEKNVYLNKETNERVTFPRIGSFEIYIYNVLIFSKLFTNAWPNHYKILETLHQIIQHRKKGNSLQSFSVYQISQNGPSLQLPSPDKKHKISSKKKKVSNNYRVYKSIERGPIEPKDIKMQTLDVIRKEDKPGKKAHRYLESKLEPRVKLPSLHSSVLPKQQDEREERKEKEKEKEKSKLKQVVEAQKQGFDPIEEIQKEELSFIERKFSNVTENHKFSSMELKEDEDSSIRRNDSLMNEIQNEQLKFLENRSVQYSDRDYGKELMNRSIQYEEEQGFQCDFGLQIDDGSMPKEIKFQYVQTERVELQETKKVYMLDQNVQANIEIIKDLLENQTQTIILQATEATTNTEIISQINRGFQFPEENPKVLNSTDIIDSSFQHLYQKRRNIVDHNYYSIDRFEQKATKYKWVGRSTLNDHPQQLQKQLFLQTIVFSVYNYYGIKTPEKRLSFQQCSNVIGDKLKDACLHILTFDNPELQYLFQFQQCDAQAQKYPLAETITFKNSKQRIKFRNYGGFLAIAYFLNDYEIFSSEIPLIGVVVVNEAVKEIHKLSALHYQVHPSTKNSQQSIIIHSNLEQQIKLDRLSEEIELQFFAMMCRVTDGQIFEEMMRNLEENFIHMSASHQQYKSTLLSLKTERIDVELVQDFMKMLRNRMEKMKELFKGKLYTYKKYHTLTPTLKYSIPFDHKIQRKLKYKDKVVALTDVIKHVRNQNNIVLLTAPDGIGKSTLLQEMAGLLRANDKVNVIEIGSMRSERTKMKDELFRISKNIVVIDNGQRYEMEIIDLIEKYRKTQYEISYCISTCNPKQIDVFNNRFSNMTVVPVELLPFDPELIKAFLMKAIKNQTFTSKKDAVDLILSKPKYLQVLENPLYLNLYSAFLSNQNLEGYKLKQKEISKYMILRESFNRCITVHNEQFTSMGISSKEVLGDLRRMAFEYFHNNGQINESISELIDAFRENQLIRNQLVFYPINLDSVLSTSSEDLFTHNQFFHYFLVQAYSYFVEKKFRNMKMHKLYSNKALMELISQRYALEDSYAQLLQVIFQSKKFKNTSEQSSNSATLLNKMEYVFSNLNFDDCKLGEADLSNSVFYACTFRNCDLDRAVLYRSQMLSCIFDNTNMSSISLYTKKFEIQYTALTSSLSVDGKRIAFGCGNYLIIINAESGAEVKRLEAHLDVIRSVKFTKDGHSLISIADDKTLRIWDVYTFKSVVFKLPQKGSISYSSETETIASVTKNSLKVWNLKSMANEVVCEGHSDLVSCVEFSYDGELIVTGSKDCTVRLWTIKGNQRNVYKGHAGEVLVTKISPNNRTILSSSKEKDLIMWETETCNQIINKKFQSEVIEICLDNKEKYVLVTFSNDARIGILDFYTLQLVHSLAGHQGRIMTINYDSSFKRLISLGKDRSARIWEFDQIMQEESTHRKIQKKVCKGPILALAYDNLAHKYATSHSNGEINLWDAQTNHLQDQIFSHEGPVKCLSFDKSGKIYSGGSDGTLRIWNLEMRRQPRNIEVHSSEMLQLKLSEKSRLIATSSAANELVIHDFTGIKIVMSTREEGRINAIQFNKDQKIMAVGGAEKYVVLYEIVNANTINRTEELGQHSDSINCLSFFGDNLLVVALKNGHVSIWNHLKGSLLKKIENVSPIRSLLAFQKKFVCFSSEDGKIRIVNMDEGREVKVFRFSEYSSAIDTDAGQNVLYVGTSEGNIIKWNLNSVKPPKKKVEFDRRTIDADCSREVVVYSGRSLLIKDLFYHREEIVEVKTESEIEGVTFDGDRVIMLLKNGKYWEHQKAQYRFEDANSYEGQLCYIRDKNATSFYKSGIKKVKGLTKPTLSVIEEANPI